MVVYPVTVNTRGRRVMDLSGARTARKALKEVRKLKKGIEVKRLDTSGTDATLAQVGSTTDIFAPPAGTTDVTRVGDKVNVKSISMRVNIKALVATTKPHGYIRILVLYVKSIGTGVPTGILKASTPESLYNADATVNYKVITDTLHYMSASDGLTAVAVTPGGQAQRIIRKNFSFKTPLLYDNDGTQVKGRFVQILVHDYEDEDISINWDYRFRFTDM